MSVLSKLTNFVSGSLFREVKDIAMAYFPPDATPEQKLAMERAMNEKQIQTMQIINQTEVEFNQRIKDMEGTASDLLRIPVAGPIMIFLRGCQRPFWSFATMYMDFLWLFSEKQLSSTQEKTLLFVNVIVLIFLFGERAIKNALPVVNAFFKSKNK